MHKQNSPDEGDQAENGSKITPDGALESVFDNHYFSREFSEFMKTTAIPFLPISIGHIRPRKIPGDRK